MPTGRQEDLITKAGQLLESLAALDDVLERYDKVTREVIAEVERGTPLVTALHVLGGSVVRPEVTAALDSFEAARHRVRVAMFGLGLEQGASISEIGRSLGISRQLASRLAAEATAD